MKILEIKTTDGPNYWSIRRKQLVVMSLDLEDLEDRPTHRIPSFYERITALMPSLIEHRCSEGVRGGFLSRVRFGTWMGHVIEHIALEIQSLAGMETGFGRTREAGKKGVYHVVFSYVDSRAGIYAAAAAVRIATALVEGSPYDLQQDLAALRSIYSGTKLGPSTSAIVEEAKKRNIPVLRLNNESLVQLGYGINQRRIEAAVASTTSNIAVELAADKDATKRILAENGVPVADGEKVCMEEELLSAIGRIGYPIVIKPLDGNHGNGATTDIRDLDVARKAFALAKTFSRQVLCERFIEGHDFRILVVNYRFSASALRRPASVTGDGVHSIQQLVDQANLDMRRGNGHENVLTKLVIDPVTVEELRRYGYGIDSVPAEGEEVRLKPTANLSTGGTATDVTDLVHPDNKLLFERIARIIGLDICGIDVIAPCLSEPLGENGGVILEVNAGPGLRMHLQPSLGMARNVAEPIIDMLFPKGKNGRIPIIGITGTNGKTTTTRLIAHICRYAGHKVGCTTTDGIYIDDQMIAKGDCTGPVSARTVLKDPAVDMAVLECARGGILRGGLGFDACNVAVITNIGEDHLGMKGIDSLEKLARVKGVLAESVAPDGYAVLNADDEHVYALRDRLQCRIALFSMHADNVRIRQHVREGGIAAVYENGFLSLIREGVMTRIGKAAEIPITYSGQARFNVANALAASLAAFVHGFDAAAIFSALASFIPSPETIPGRMNMFEFGDFKIIVDYAHNTHGLRAINDFIRSMPASVRIGVLAGVGDRRDKDIISMAREAALIFDEIIIRQDKDLRGRQPGELNGLLYKGIQGIDPLKKVTLIPEERKAVEALLQRAERGMVAVVFADDIPAVIAQLQTARDLALQNIHEAAIA
jgi:cyanophycin synthetase